MPLAMVKVDKDERLGQGPTLLEDEDGIFSALQEVIF